MNIFHKGLRIGILLCLLIPYAHGGREENLSLVKVRMHPKHIPDLGIKLISSLPVLLQNYPSLFETRFSPTKEFELPEKRVLGLGKLPSGKLGIKGVQIRELRLLTPRVTALTSGQGVTYDVEIPLERVSVSVTADFSKLEDRKTTDALVGNIKFEVGSHTAKKFNKKNDFLGPTLKLRMVVDRDGKSVRILANDETGSQASSLRLNAKDVSVSAGPGLNEGVLRLLKLAGTGTVANMAKGFAEKLQPNFLGDLIMAALIPGLNDTFAQLLESKDLVISVPSEGPRPPSVGEIGIEPSRFVDLDLKSSLEILPQRMVSLDFLKKDMENSKSDFAIKFSVPALNHKLKKNQEKLKVCFKKGTFGWMNVYCDGAAFQKGDWIRVSFDEPPSLQWDPEGGLYLMMNPKVESSNEIVNLVQKSLVGKFYLDPQMFCRTASQSGVCLNKKDIPAGQGEALQRMTVRSIMKFLGMFDLLPSWMKEKSIAKESSLGIQDVKLREDSITVLMEPSAK